MFKFFNFITLIFFVVIINGCGQNHEAQSQAIHNQPKSVGYLRIPLKTPAIHRRKSLEHLLSVNDTAESVKNQLNPAQTMSEASLPLGVKAIDDYTVEFTLEYPAGYFPFLVSLWTYRPLPRNVIEKYGNKWTEPEHIQTNGSYQLTEWHKNQKLIIKKNPDYYDVDKVAIPAACQQETPQH
jgi:ABC-type transport system substrate-binding protein